MNNLLVNIGKCVLEGDRKQLTGLVQQAIDKNIVPDEILSKGMIANGMDIVAHRFREGECFVPEVLASARAMHTGMDLLKPLLAKAGNKSVAKVVLGTVYGDHHDIGKKIVAMMLEGGGFEVKDIGTNVRPEIFIEEARNFGAQIIGMSTLLTTTVISMEKTCALIKESDLKGKVKIMVGGAPISEKIARGAGADGYAENAGEVVVRAKEMLSLLGG